MNNIQRRKRAHIPMIKASLSSFEIELLTSAGKKMVEEELAELRKEAKAKATNNH